MSRVTSRIVAVVCAVAMVSLMPRLAGAADDRDIAAEFDRALLDTLANGDKAAAGALLDTDFTWTDAFGVRSRRVT